MNKLLRIFFITVSILSIGAIGYLYSPFHIDYLFGYGIVGMPEIFLSTIVFLLSINGFVACNLVKYKQKIKSDIKDFCKLSEEFNGLHELNSHKDEVISNLKEDKNTQQTLVDDLISKTVSLRNNYEELSKNYNEQLEINRQLGEKLSNHSFDGTIIPIEKIMSAKNKKQLFKCLQQMRSPKQKSSRKKVK